MATAPPKPDPALAEPRSAPPSPEQAARQPDSDEAPGDRTVLVFWLIAFGLLAFITLADLVLRLFR
jgi:hypothetical protein